MVLLLGSFIALITVVLLLILGIMIVLSLTKKKPFPRKILLATLTGVLLLGSIYVYERYFFTFEEINQSHVQEGPGPIDSPDGTYTVNAFYEPYGGAAGGVNVWVEVVHKALNNDPRIVYYSDAKSHFQMEWLDDQTLRIENSEPSYPEQSRSVTLNVAGDIYHDQGDACRSWVLGQEYETCYEADT